MSCCGKSRVQAAMIPRISVPPTGTVAFEYTGKSRLTVVGPITRTRYDFARHGARLTVDPRDSKSLATVPALRRV